MSDRAVQVLRWSLFALLILWGGYTVLAYVGVPVHQAVLLSEADKADISRICGGEAAAWCNRWQALLPSILHTFGRAAPFLWYAIASLAIFGTILVLGYLRDGKWRFRMSLTPWKLLLFAVAFLWLLFTVMGRGDNDGQPFNRVFEPLPQVYVNAGPESLAELKEDFESLRDRGCLTEVGITNHNARIYDYGFTCMQAAFFTRVLPLVAVVFVFFLTLLVFGRAVLSVMRMRPALPLLEFLLSLGLGACGLIALLWLMALFGIYWQSVGWVLILGILALGYPHTRYWSQRFLSARWNVDVPLKSGLPILTWLLLSYLAFNFLSVIRPFPIGWDDLGRYLNQPRLLVSYGHIIPTMSSFQWEYLTSLGFLLFGYDSVFGATTSMMINWAAGLLAVFVVYGFARLFLGTHRGVLSALLYYTLPLVGHFSFADMKVDNGVFAMAAFTILAICLYLFPLAEEEEDEPAPDWRWMALAGIFAGFAFSLKPTNAMLITAVIALLLGAGIHWTGFVAGFFLTWMAFAFQGQLNLTDISVRLGSSTALIGPGTFLAICAILTATFLGYAFWLQRGRFIRTMRGLGIFVLCAFFAILPWLLYNNVQSGNVIPRLILAAPNRISPNFNYTGEASHDPELTIRTLPPELTLDPNHASCKSTSKAEELDRYWGYRTGLEHYLTLPWRTVMNLDSAGYYVTLMPALLLFPLILLLPYTWSRRGKWIRWMFWATVLFILQWMIFANGIPWYGIGMFLGLCVALEALAFRSPDRASKITASLLIAVSLITNFAMRFWQFESQTSLFEYPMGKVSAEALRERVIPHYDDIRDVVMDRFVKLPDRPYVYRVGTFIPYFIPKNLEVLPNADHQLDSFTCLHQERDDKKTLARLKALGFNSIIFDTNTHTIERDPNGTLHKKVERFVNFLNNPELGLQMVVNDPGAGVAFLLIP